METLLGESLGFLESLGFFEVLLPFLLVFVMVFALLERTKIFGVEKVDDVEIPKRNLNAMFAFSISFLAIVSSKVVSAIHKAVGPIMILLLLIVLFLLLVSVFERSDEGYKLFGDTGKLILTIVILIVIVLIFLGSITNSSGVSWLDYILSWFGSLSVKNSGGAVGAIVLLLIIAGIVAWIGKSPSQGGKE